MNIDLRFCKSKNKIANIEKLGLGLSKLFELNSLSLNLDLFANN